MKTKFILYHIMSAVLVLSGCNLNGTDTGNPITDDNSGNQCGKIAANTGYNSSCVLSPAPLSQAGQICKKLNSCLQVPTDKCYEKVVHQPELSKYISIDVDTYSQMHTLVQNRTVITDPKSYNECMTALDQIDCSSSLVNNAVNINNTDPDNIRIDYANVHSILNASISCKFIYSFKN
jgi:hypothetical protein